MRTKRNVIVTRKEALALLGIRRASLLDLERAARIPADADRAGYTSVEIQRLFSAARKVLQ